MIHFVPKEENALCLGPPARYMATEKTYESICIGQKESTLTVQHSTTREQNLTGLVYMAHKLGL